MPSALALRLVASGAVSQADAEAALLASLARRIPFVRALVDTGAIGEARLDHELEQLGGIGLRHVAGMPELVNRLPPHFCRRMGILPVRVDHAARVVEIAAADPLDVHLPAEVAFHLGVPVRVLRAPIAAIEDAIRRIELEAEAAAGRTRRATPPFPHGAPESSNPPPPPPDPAPIPLVRRTSGGDRPPDTLRLYKATLRPGAMGPDLDFGDTATSTSGAGDVITEPIPLRSLKTAQPRGQHPADDADAEPASSEPAPRTLRDSAPRLRDLVTPVPPLTTPEPAPAPAAAHDAPLRDGSLREPRAAHDAPLRESTRLRDLAASLSADASPAPAPVPESTRSAAPPSERPRSVRDSTPRLRDLIDQPPPIDRLRDSTPRLRELGALIARETSAEADTAPVSSIVASDPGPPAEPPAVSFPSMPPPSILDEPGLLAADDEWVGPVPSASAPPPDAGPRHARRPSRFARPAIDIQLPQPPSERARRQRTIWDVPLGGGPGGSTSGHEEPAEPPESLVSPGPPSRDGRVSLPRAETLDTTAVLEALRAAGSRDEVVAAALRGLRTVGRRAAIFVVRRDGFHGWACNVELGDQEQLRHVAVPHDAPSLFATAVATGSYFGPIPLNAVHAPLVAVLDAPASDVAVAVARAGGKPVMLLFADDLVDIKRRVLPRLVELGSAVGAALSRLLAARL